MFIKKFTKETKLKKKKKKHPQISTFKSRFNINAYCNLLGLSPVEF